MVGGTPASVLADLSELGIAGRDGKPGLNLILNLPNYLPQWRLAYTLSARGRRVARQIMASLETPNEVEAVAKIDRAPQDLKAPQPPPVVAQGSEEPPSSSPAPLDASTPEPPPPARRTPQRARVSQRLPKFRYKGHPLRAVRIDGVPWFLAGDLCRILGRDTSAGTAKALRSIKDEDQRLIRHSEVPAGFLGDRCYQTKGVSLAGFHKLVKFTTGPAARAFEQWAQERVVPRL